MKYTPENLDRELQAAKRSTKQHLVAYRPLIRGYATPFSNSEGEAPYQPENHAYEWVTNTLMQIVDDNPDCSVKSKRGGKYGLYADALNAAGDRWCEENELDHFIRTGPGLNLNFARGVAYVDLVENKSKFRYQPGPKEDKYDEPVMPKARNISPEDFVCDPLHSDPDDWMYCGHRTIWDKDALLEKARSEDGWDVALLEHAISTTASEDARKRDGIDRDEIVTWEIWCPHYKIEDDEDTYSGAIVTLLDYSYLDSSIEHKFPRKPRGYYGPKIGPYALFDALKVPEDGWPIAPLVASKGQADEVNRESLAMTRAMDNWKRLLFTTDKKLAEAIKNKPTDTVHVVSAGALKDSVVAIEVGGLSTEQLTAFQFRRERLDRISGLTEASKGQSATGNTATADVIANAGAQVRLELLRRAVHRGTRGVVYRVLWYMFHENQIATYLGEVPETDEQGQPVPDEETGQPATQKVWFRGGPKEEGDCWDAYEFSIDVTAMERPSEALQQRQAAFLVTDLPAVAVAQLQAPQIDWGAWAAEVSDLLSMPAIKTLVNPKVLGQVQALMLQSQVAPASTDGKAAKTPESPRMEPKAPPAPQPQGRAGPAQGAPKPAASGPAKAPQAA
jgi:hypothetical protein